MPEPVPHPEEDNPYRPPSAKVDDAEGTSGRRGLFDDVEPENPAAIRARYLSREATVRTIGLIYFLAVGLSLVNLGLILSFPQLQADMIKALNSPMWTAEAVRYLMIGGVLFGSLINVILAIGLRAYLNPMRWIVVIFIVLAFLASIRNLFTMMSTSLALDAIFSFVSTVVFLNYAIFLASSKSSPIFTSEFRAAVAATPEIKPTFGPRDKVFLGLYGLVFVLAFATQLVKALRSN